MNEKDRSPGAMLASLLCDDLTPDEKAEKEKEFQQATVDYFAKHGVKCTMGEITHPSEKAVK